MQRPLMLGIGGLALVITGGLVYLASWAGSPAVSKPIAEPVQSSEGTVVRTTLLRSPYFEAEVPSDMTVRVKEDQGKAPMLAQYVFYSSQVGQGDQLAITIGELPSTGLKDVSHVKFRTQDTARYEPLSIPGAPDTVLAFRTLDGYEVSIFYPDQNHYAAIVLSGKMERADSLNKAYGAIIASWSWKQD